MRVRTAAVVNDRDELYAWVPRAVGFSYDTGAFDASFAPGGGPVSWANIFGGYGFAHVDQAWTSTWRTSIRRPRRSSEARPGGGGQDGLNNTVSLTHNYGDHFRGEIAPDPAGDPVVATSTFSAGLPTTPGALQAAYSGAQDGFVFRMNPALTNLQWATYIGGTGEDSAYGVQFDSNGDLFVTGGTTSSNLPMAGTPFDNSQNGRGGWLPHEIQWCHGCIDREHVHEDCELRPVLSGCSWIPATTFTWQGRRMVLIP